MDRLGQGPSLVILLRSEGTLDLLKEVGRLSQVRFPVPMDGGIVLMKYPLVFNYEKCSQKALIHRCK